MRFLSFFILAGFIFAHSELLPYRRINGFSDGEWFGWSLCGVDIDGDGRQEIAVGAPLHSGGTPYSYRGAVYIFRSGTGAVVAFHGHSSTEQLGIDIDNAGDINGDGYDDLIVGANVAGDIGRAYIYFGGADFDTIADLSVVGEEPIDNFGYAVAGLGDINADGYDDFATGALYNDARGNRTGRVYIYFGGFSPDSIPDIILTGLDSLDDFGTDISGGFDFNGDGEPDLLVGAVQAGSYWRSPGEAYLFYGGAAMDTLADIFTTGENPTDFYGGTVAFIGDHNGDGYDDFVVGAYNNSTAGDGTGRAYLFLGSFYHSGDADIIVSGRLGEHLGGVVASVGDMNDDDFDDWAASSDLTPDDSSFGAVYIFCGSSAPDGVYDYYCVGEHSDDHFGWSIASLGDVDGDGLTDMAVGAPGYGGAGAVYIYRGFSSIPHSNYLCGLHFSQDSLAPQLLSFGQAPGATDGYDSGYDILMLPPTPGQVDARLIASDSTPPYIEYLRRDMRSFTSTDERWNIATFGDGLCTVRWDRDILPTGIFLWAGIVDMRSDSINVFPMRRDIDISFEWRLPEEAVIYVSPGWNIIGLQGYPVEYNVERIFGRDIWFYDASARRYCQPERYPTGFGAFYYSSSMDSLVVSFFPASSFRRLLSRGWNLIAAPAGTTSLSDISTSPVGALVPGAIYYLHDGHYESASELVGGVGYFILAAEQCTLSVGAEAGER